MTTIRRQFGMLASSVIAGAALFAGGASSAQGAVQTANAVSNKCHLVSRSPRRVVCVVQVSGTITASQARRVIAARPAGARVVFRSRPGTRATIRGTLTINRPRVTIALVRVTGAVNFKARARWGRLLGSSAWGFGIFGADDVTIQGNLLDGRGRRTHNPILDTPRAIPQRFMIRRNRFVNYFGVNASDHSEALYIGFSAGGRIYRNTFVNNGTTAHIFFTYWGARANPSYSYPRSICLRGNRFGRTHGAFYDVNLRGEIPRSSLIRIDPRQRATVSPRGFIRVCP